MLKPVFYSVFFQGKHDYWASRKHVNGQLQSQLTQANIVHRKLEQLAGNKLGLTIANMFPTDRFKEKIMPSTQKKTAI